MVLVFTTILTGKNMWDIGAMIKQTEEECIYLWMAVDMKRWKKMVREMVPGIFYYANGNIYDGE